MAFAAWESSLHFAKFKDSSLRTFRVRMKRYQLPRLLVRAARILRM